MANKRIRKKTVVITGASGGLGEKIAFAAAKNGANLVLLARSLDKLEKSRRRSKQFTRFRVWPSAAMWRNTAKFLLFLKRFITAAAILMCS